MAAHRGLAQLVERGLFLLGAMTDDGLRAAVVEPARSVGLIVEFEPRFTPDGSRLITVSWSDRVVRIWDVATG